ncbi:MAG: FAD:protein FMN transferase [Planctomycetota bacterium]|jgi:thiamine biosynthesis lipoprotein
MTEPRPEVSFVQSDWTSISGIRRFCREAMATTFEIMIVHADGRYARQAANAAFDELDRLDARINNLAADRPLIVDLDVFQCLKLAARIHDETSGAFDVTIGSLFRCWLDEDKKLRSPSQEELEVARRHTGIDLLQLDEAEHTVRLPTAGVQVDLGGIGKGYAVDRMADLLGDWSIRTALIHGGYSSVMGLDAPAEMKGWPVALRYPGDDAQPAARLLLENRALSGSGLQAGRHIIDPRTARPVEGKLAAWACAPDAAGADALSTAFMVMAHEEIKQYCQCHPDTLVIVLPESDAEPKNDKILRWGPWEKSGLQEQ